MAAKTWDSTEKEFYTEEDLIDYRLAEEILRDAKETTRALEKLGFEGEIEGYEAGDEIYTEIEEVVEHNGYITSNRIQEIGREILRENGWPNPDL